MDREKMTEAQRHIENAQSMLDAHSERSLVAETLDGLLVEIERLDALVKDRELQELSDLGQEIEKDTREGPEK